MKALLAKILILVFLIGATVSPRTLGAAEYPYETPPAAEAEPTPGQDLGYGVGSVLCSILYSPLKVTYAGLGLLIGGIGWALSAGNPYVANNIIYPAVTGNYVITPNHLKGREPVIFIGSPPPSQAPLEMSPSPASPAPYGP